MKLIAGIWLIAAGMGQSIALVAMTDVWPLAFTGIAQVLAVIALLEE